jgi:hypothetical protein
MDRSMLLKLWDESWTEGTWFGSWSKALEGVDAEKAAWTPAGGPHSIWQLVNHVSFWREYTVRALDGDKMDAAEVERLNFEAPRIPDAEAWTASLARLEESHRGLRAVMADESKPVERPLHHLVHDANHLGQILYLRAMMGLPKAM